jgi:5-methyltetrahydrofolate--homocysteine methyltransferase
VSLLYKEDWEETKDRYRTWWAGESTSRCAIWVTAPRADAPDGPPPEAPGDHERKWTDLDYWARLREWEFRRTFYGGEAFPIWNCGYPGRENLAVFMGCPVTLREETGWVDPILTGDDLDARRLALDLDGRWWKFSIRAHEFAVEQSRGEAIPSTGAFGGSGDTLASLRGTERLLFDCVDRPERVRDADRYLMDLWIEVFERYHAIVGETAQGSTGWFALWSPGKFYAAQNDFSYMISTKMFTDLFLPTVEKQTEFLDHSVYHVDGVEAFAHVDALCVLPRLGALQILPGAGKPSPLRDMPVLKKVQAAGKNLHISIPSGEVRAALAELSARGLFIATSCRTEEEARSLLSKAETWSVDRAV